MKTKLIFSTETKDTEYWTDLPFVPRAKEWFNVNDILGPDVLQSVRDSAKCWSGIKGIVETVEYKRDEKEYYTEIMVWCED
jgi:hypothetical protein